VNILVQKKCEHIVETAGKIRSKESGTHCRRYLPPKKETGANWQILPFIVKTTIKLFFFCAFYKGPSILQSILFTSPNDQTSHDSSEQSFDFHHSINPFHLFPVWMSIISFDREKVRKLDLGRPREICRWRPMSFGVLQ